MICIELICFDSKVDIVYILKNNNLQLLGEVKCFGASEFASFMKRWYALSWFVLIRKLINGLRLKKINRKLWKMFDFLVLVTKVEPRADPKTPTFFSP